MVREIMPARLKLGRQAAIGDQYRSVRFGEHHDVTLIPARFEVSTVVVDVSRTEDPGWSRRLLRAGSGARRVRLAIAQWR
ncbi:hypothetical protein GCM10017772_10710 [Promicromonospora soli]|uniref:Uncharacterized protein n=1 Tax=Promicromonospora soli TaxID=2035533 RepID=A0A919KQ62_9MICO|nr:hypothetical protein GCM10017772_10710 [Promicromonospora soli]